MTIDEKSRYELFTRLEEVLGKDHATVLMEHLPPVGWADVATKNDLAQLEARFEARMEARFDAVDSRFETMEQRLLAAFRGELNAQSRMMIFSMTTAFVGVAGVALAAARLV